MFEAVRSWATGSMQRKLLLSVGAVIAAAFVVLMAVTTSFATGEVTAATNQKLDSTAQAHANELDTELTRYDTFAQSLAGTMEEYDRGSASREEVNGMLENLAEDNPRALGVYVAYEPDAFDGQDSAYRNDSTTGSNQAGRFAPYWNRYGEGLSQAPLNNLESQDWYTQPMESEHGIIKGPFTYQNRTMVSFIYPIMRNGEPVGIAGIDISIDYWQDKTAAVNVSESGYAFVVGNDGRFVAHPNESWRGTRTLSNVSQTASAPGLGEMQSDIDTGDAAGSVTITDPVTGQAAIVQYAPVDDGRFVIATVSPKSEALAGVHDLRNSLVGISVISLLVLLGLIYFITDWFVRPIGRVTESFSAIADTGDLSKRPDVSTNDEVGEMVDAFDSMRQQFVTTADQAEAIADQRFDDRVFDEDVPGRLGEALDTMHHDTRQNTEELEQLAETLEEQAREYGTVMSRCAEGNLTERMDTDADNESMREIAERFNAMMDELEGTVLRIQSFADEVAAESGEARVSIDEVQDASEQVSDSTQEIATGAERQSEDLMETADEMSSLSASVEEVAAAANQVADASEEAAERGADAQSHAEDAIGEMTEIETRTETTVAEVESLDEEIKQISEIVEMITGIAEQTNLLALNASIEAARAGEAGEGFAVVADEIKQLAEEAGRATQEIEQLIDEIVDSTEDAVEDMQATGESVTEGVDTVERALEALDDVVEQFDETNQGIQEIDDATADQAGSTEEIVGMIEEIASVSEQTTAEASTVSAASEEQTASLNEVATTVGSLSDRADELQSLLDEFDVENSSSGAASAEPRGPATEDVINPVGPASTDGGSVHR